MKSYLGKEVPITSLKPGKVKPVGLFFLTEIWNYDGEYLTVISTKDKYPITNKTTQKEKFESLKTILSIIEKSLSKTPIIM